MSFNFRIDSIKDLGDVREALQKVKEALVSFPLNKGQWKFFSITLTGAVTNFTYPHGLSFIPKHILQVSVTGVGSVTWNYSSFDKTNVSLTTTGACTVDAYIGRHREESDA